MTGIFASKAVAGKPRCARCGRPFTPRKEGDLYGPKCARIIAGLIHVGALVHVDRTDARGEPPVDDRLNLDDIAETRHTVIV